MLTNSKKEKRDAIREKIHENGVQTSVHYPAIHRFSIYKDFKAQLPVTEYVTDNEITLPMYASLSEQDVDFIVATLDKAING